MKLIDKIKLYNEAYRQGYPQVSDKEYDELVEELRRTDPNNDWFQHIEPVVVSASRKVTLPIPMKSLNKVKSLLELQKWYKSLGIKDRMWLVCMPKFDGLSLLYDEKTGKAYSRGGAENEGQNCTEHYKAANIISPITDFHYTFGEFIFTRTKWEEFKASMQDNPDMPCKSPRNTAAGLLNRDEPCEYLKAVSFFRYGIDDDTLMSTYLTFADAIRDICITYQQPHLYKVVTPTELSEEYLASLYKQWSHLYPIDGIVVYINDLAVWSVIGRNTTTGNPLYAVAYKHPDFTDTFETTVTDVEWNISKSGMLKPVVKIETVDTGECEIDSPTGYNAKWIAQHEIAKDAKILITRSGGVIPKILETLTPASETEKSRMWNKLTFCPVCGSPTKWNTSLVELCCSNKHCPGTTLAKIIFFYKTCGAENLGDETIAKIFNAGFTTIKAFLNITAEDLFKIEGFGDATVQIILDNNARIKQGVELPVLMHASDCFKGIGTIKATKFISSLSEKELDEFLRGWYLANKPEPGSKEFETLPITTQSLMFGYYPFMDFLREGVPYILPQKPEKRGDKCQNMLVCISGFRDSEFEKNVVSEGGKIVSGVSKNTTHLVVKDTSATSSKIQKARALGVQILSLTEFNTKFSSD